VLRDNERVTQEVNLHLLYFIYCKQNCAMQREEKQLDSALEAIIMRVNDLKAAIASMMYKLEHEYEALNWPNFLDNFALISGHVNISFY